MINGRKSAPAVITLLETGAFRSHLRLVLFEGRKREIRLMCRAVGHPVLRLLRLAIGPLELGDLPLGASRPLNPEETAGLRASAGLAGKSKKPAAPIAFPPAIR
jgi:pseudouridine synthase